MFNQSVSDKKGNTLTRWWAKATGGGSYNGEINGKPVYYPNIKFAEFEVTDKRSLLLRANAHAMGRSKYVFTIDNVPQLERGHSGSIIVYGQQDLTEFDAGADRDWFQIFQVDKAKHPYLIHSINNYLRNK